MTHFWVLWKSKLPSVPLRHLSLAAPFVSAVQTSMVYSESEQKILAIFPHITGGLSLIGSSSIVYDIWKDRDYKMKQPYFRILLGMSIFDLICSMSLCLSTIPIPAGTEGVFGARGTTGTCTASGFFNQFMLGSILYNFVLAIYYALSGTYRMADEDFAKRYEPWLHGLAVMATIGVAIGKLLPVSVPWSRFFTGRVNNHYSTPMFHRH